METSQEAFNILRGGRRFDLIICDLMIPDPTSIDLYEELLRVAPDRGLTAEFVRIPRF